MKKQIIDNPFLDWYTIIYLFWKRKEIDIYVSGKFNEKIETPEDFDWVHYYQWHTSIVCIFNEEKIDEKVVIHEITHAVQKMLYFLNIPWDYSNTELVANLMEYYISEWLKFYKIIKENEKI